MSVAYGSPPGGYMPPGRVNFGWIGEAFELYKANFAVWIVAALMLFVVPSVIGAVVGGINTTAALHPPSGNAPPPLGTNPYGRANSYANGLPIALNLAIQVFSLVYQAYLYGGIYRVAVKQVRGERNDVGDLFSGGPLMLKMLGFQLLYFLAAAVGFLFFIIPALLVAGLLLPAYALIADGEGVFTAISRSVDAMKRDVWSAAGFVFVLGLLMFAGLFAFCLGEFVTTPMFWLVSALAYRDMVGMPSMAASPYGAVPYGAPAPYAPGVWPPPPGQAPPYGQQPPSYGQAPPYGQPPAFGQTPYGQPAPPPPSFGQPPTAPPRRSLGGDPLEDEGGGPQRPNLPPGGPSPQ